MPSLSAVKGVFYMLCHAFLHDVIALIDDRFRKIQSLLIMLLATLTTSTLACPHFAEPRKPCEGKCLVLAVDASYGETTKQVREFFRENKLRLPVVLDEYGKSADIFGVTMTTTTVVIDAQGRLRYIGRLKDGDKTPAEDALKAVLAGTDVLVQSTKPRG